MLRRRIPVLLSALVIMAGLMGTTGCVKQAPPAPAEERKTAPPWSAPRDAISYIKAAGLEPLPLDITDHQRTLMMTITLDGERVEIPANVGIDRVRALQAAVHTHENTGKIWLEGKGSDRVTLGEFFTVWGVRFDDHCLGNVCGQVTVRVDGAATDEAPTDIVLAQASALVVQVEKK